MFLVPGTEEKMLGADYWIGKLQDKSRLIMDEDSIRIFNEEIIGKSKGVLDIFKCKKTLERSELVELINLYKIPSEIRYDIKGDEISKEFYNSLIINTNLDGVKDETSIRYGIAIRNTDIRSFPTSEYIFKTREDKEFDRFQETGCQAFEPVLVLHESRDGKWYFIQMYNYSGWVRKEDIAIGEKNAIEEFAKPGSFVIVTGNYVQLQYNPYDSRISRLKLYMGTKIPLLKDLETIDNQGVLNNYPVKIPVRDEKGRLEFKAALISKSEDLNEGYLPYTRENILRQIFKLLGDRYGWGDRFSGRDCSSTIMYVYKTFGLRLARNASEQEEGPGRLLKLEGLDGEKRDKCFEGVNPGAAIYMPGHVMMYIGMDNDEPFMIHNFHGYSRLKDEELEFVPVNQVFVTSTHIITSSGKKYIDDFTSILEFDL